MSEGMLGRLPLSAVRGPRDDLEMRLAGVDGEDWLRALKRMLRKENPWDALGVEKKLSHILTVDRTSLPGPEEFLSPAWTIWRGPVCESGGLEGEPEQDSLVLSQSEIDLSKVRFESELKDVDFSLNSDVAYHQRKKQGHRLDYWVSMALWREHGRISLHWLYEQYCVRLKIPYKGEIIFEFPGTVLRSSAGYPHIARLRRSSDEVWWWEMKTLNSRGREETLFIE